MEGELIIKQELDKKLKELKELAKPLQEWLKKYYDPHHKIEVTVVDVEVLSGVMGRYFKLD